MKRKKSLLAACLLMFLAVSLGITAKASELKPVTISPGSETEVVTVWQNCPTFSWSAVDQAASYRVAIFEVSDTIIMPYDEMAATATPLIIKDIHGPGLSWTLSSEKSLETGNMYAWYVQAMDTLGNTLGDWSGGKIFKVDKEIYFVGIEEKLAEKMRGYGVNEETITNVLTDMKSEVKEVELRGKDITITAPNNDGLSGVQGYEGVTNTAYGLTAGVSITTGNRNSFFGREAGEFTTSGQANTFLGYAAGVYNTTGFGNTFVGAITGLDNSTGSFNTFIGYEAGYENTTGYKNTFIGEECGVLNTVGYSNTFLGHLSGNNNTTGYNNTFIGQNSGYSNTSGNTNTFLGYSAGYINTTGVGNLFLGYYAGYNETGSNKLFIDNSSTSSPLIYGEFDNDIVTIHGKLGIGTKTPGYPVEVNTTGINSCIVIKRTDGATNYINATSDYANFGCTTNHPLRLVVNSAWKMMLNTDGSLSMSNGAWCTTGGVWTNASSRELKENIQDLRTTEAMETLSLLNPVKYNYKVDRADKHVGFIAEDVPELVATADRKGMSPMDVVAVLTRVVQEQQKIIADLQERMAKIEENKK